jgi:hypothetical protein
MCVVLSGAALQGARADEIVESGVPGICISLRSGRTTPCPVSRQPAVEVVQNRTTCGDKPTTSNACSTHHRRAAEIVDSGVPGICLDLKTGRTMSCPVIGVRNSDEKSSTMLQPTASMSAGTDPEAAGRTVAASPTQPLATSASLSSREGEISVVPTIAHPPASALLHQTWAVSRTDSGFSDPSR